MLSGTLLSESENGWTKLMLNEVEQLMTGKLEIGQKFYSNLEDCFSQTNPQLQQASVNEASQLED